MENMVKAFEDLRIAIENAKEQCDIALDELSRLKVENQTADYMKSLTSLIEKLTRFPPQ